MSLARSQVAKNPQTVNYLPKISSRDVAITSMTSPELLFSTLSFPPPQLMMFSFFRIYHTENTLLLLFSCTLDWIIGGIDKQNHKLIKRRQTVKFHPFCHSINCPPLDVLELFLIRYKVKYHSLSTATYDINFYSNSLPTLAVNRPTANDKSLNNTVHSYFVFAL